MTALLYGLCVFLFGLILLYGFVFGLGFWLSAIFGLVALGLVAFVLYEIEQRRA